MDYPLTVKHTANRPAVVVWCGDPACDLFRIVLEPDLGNEHPEGADACALSIRDSTRHDVILRGLLETESVAIACGLLRALRAAGLLSDEFRAQVRAEIDGGAL